MKKPGPTSIAYSYLRFSSPGQADGDSLRRQTDLRDAWLKRNPEARLDTSLRLTDKGVSGFTGAHRKNPDRHALAAFLKLVEQGRVSRGSYLIVENLDRLSREDIQPALMLFLGLLQAGVRVVQLIPIEQVFDDKSESMALMMAIMELSRGNSESKVKSERCAAAWSAKKKAAREGGKVMTRRLPAWVDHHDGKLRLVPDRAKVVKRIFKLAASGYGNASIVRKFTEEGVTAFVVKPAAGKDPDKLKRQAYAGHWAKSSVAAILKDRRAVGEHQPRRRDGTPDGDPIKNYYPTLVTEAEWLAVRAGAAQRRRKPGRVGQHVNVFAGLLKDSRDGGSYYAATRPLRPGRSHRVLIPTASIEGRVTCVSFPYATLEAAVLSLLKEIDPAEVLGTEAGPNDVSVLCGELAQEDAKIAELEAELENGEVAALARKLREREARKAALVRDLADARQRAANPASGAWDELKSLADVLGSAPDPTDARLRLRSALRRVVSEAWMLVVPRGPVRAAAVQFFFAGGATRSYLVVHRAAVAPGGKLVRPARWSAHSMTRPAGTEGDDLRRPVAVKRVEKILIDLLENPDAPPPAKLPKHPATYASSDAPTPVVRIPPRRAKPRSTR